MNPESDNPDPSNALAQPGNHPEPSPQSKSSDGWTFLTNHTHVLACLAEDPHSRLRDVAQKVGITERAVQKIVADLEHSHIISRERDGRRNHYEIYEEPQLRHPVESHRTVGELLQLILGDQPKADVDASRNITGEP